MFLFKLQRLPFLVSACVDCKYRPDLEEFEMLFTMWFAAILYTLLAGLEPTKFIRPAYFAALSLKAIAEHLLTNFRDKNASYS